MGSESSGIIAAFLSSLTWAIGVTTYSLLSKKYTPFVINFTRSLVAFPLFLLVAIAELGLTGYGHVILSLTGAQLGWMFLSVLGSFGFGDVLFLWSTRGMGVPGALAIASTYPLVSALAGLFFKGETLSVESASGLVVVVLGTIAVILSGQREKRATLRNPQSIFERYEVGVVLAFMTSFCWALNAFSISKIGVVPAASANTVRTLMALAMCPFFSFLTRQTGSMFIAKKDFIPALAIFVLEGFGGAYMYIYGIMNSPLALGAALTSLAPAMSVPLALLARTEKFRWARSAGVVAVVVGIWLLVSGRG